MEHREYDMKLKVLMIGESGVGKTSLLMRYAQSSFSPHFIATLGVDFRVKYIAVDGIRIKVQVWDTAGQERFQAVTASYYRGAQGVMLVYDVTKRSSFTAIKKWLDQLTLHGDGRANRILVGTKSDCFNQRMVSHEEGEVFAREHDLHFFECSAKEDINVDEAFLALVMEIKNRMVVNYPWIVPPIVPLNTPAKSLQSSWISPTRNSRIFDYKCCK